MISSLAFAYDLSEVAGWRNAPGHDPFKPWWARSLYAFLLVICAALVGVMPDLVSLNIAAQVLNALLLPLVFAFLIALSLEALPVTPRPRGWYLAALLGMSSTVCVKGVVGTSAWEL